MVEGFGRHPVVVGVDGSEAGTNAVRFAAREAQRLGCGLEVIHVTPGYTPVGPSLPMLNNEGLRERGSSVLREAEQVARETAADVAVKTVLFTGGRVPGLVESARLAPLLVVGTTEKSFAERVWTGTTVTGVAARANCPVVVVPAGWDSARQRGRVVAAFKSPHHSSELFERAFELAARDAAELVILHVWKLASGYDDIVSTRVAEDEWAERQHAIMEPLLRDLRTQYPDVPAQVDVVHGQPAGVLIDRGASADRLMLMRPVHGGFVHHLGAVARAVLREAPCPVQVIPPLRAVASSSGLELERSGTMTK